MNNFYQSLEVGKQSEKIVLNRIKNKYPSAYIKDGYFKDFDIFIPEIDTSVEVKKDFKSQYTGNVVVEILMNGEPSALSTTKADWWVFHLDDIRFVGKGDCAYKVAYLVKKDYLYVYGRNMNVYQESYVK